MNDGQADRMNECLAAIANELAVIRHELQQMNGADAEPQDREPTLACKSCDAAFSNPEDARDHAITDHNAPDDAWQTIIQPIE